MSYRCIIDPFPNGTGRPECARERAGAIWEHRVMERAPAATEPEAESAPARAAGASAALIGGPLAPAAVLALQRTAGNAAVTALLAREPVAEKSAAPTPREALRAMLANGDE